jgi:stage V sporulation protein R
MVAKIRAEKGRWLDYVIEFTRGIDNLVGYYDELSRIENQFASGQSKRFDFYFDVFLQEELKVNIGEYIKEIERYNECVKHYGKMAEQSFFSEVDKRYPEFEAMFNKQKWDKSGRKIDIIQYIMDNSEYLNKNGNKWMKSVMEVVRKTSLFFQPQIRTKIMNEGWASYWHETLFLQDERIHGHEVEFARVNAGVTSLPRVGLNPYALGMRLFYFIEELADKGKLSHKFHMINDAFQRSKFDDKTSKGREFIFEIRKNFSDSLFISTFVDQDFVTKNNLFVAGKRLNQQKMVWEYYVKSRKAKDYRQMLLDALYHPPYIVIDEKNGEDGSLYLNHYFEGSPLIKEFIPNTMIGIEYLWGKPVQLETSEVVFIIPPSDQLIPPGFPGLTKEEKIEPEIRWQRVVYTMKERKLTRSVIQD